MSNGNNDYEDTIRRRGQYSTTIGAEISGKMSAGDDAWGRSRYNVRSNDISEDLHESLVEKAEVLENVIKECAPIVIREWKEFESAWMSLFFPGGPKGAPGGGPPAPENTLYPLVHAFVKESGPGANFSYHLGRDLGGSYAGYTAGNTVASYAAIGDAVKANVQSLSSKVPLKVASRASDTAMGLLTLFKTLTPMLSPDRNTTIFMDADDFAPFLAGAGGVTDETLRSLSDRLLATRWFLTEIEFGQLHAGGLITVENTVNATAGGSENTYNDTTPPFVSTPEAQRIHKGEQTKYGDVGDVYTHNYAGELNISEQRMDYSAGTGAHMENDEYGNVVIVGGRPAVSVASQEGHYIYPRASDLYSGNYTDGDTAKYYFSEFYWDAQLARARHSYQAGKYGNNNNLENMSIEEIEEWELAEGGKRNEFEERHRVTLGVLQSRVNSFVQSLEAQHAAGKLTTNDWNGWLSGNDLSIYTAEGTTLNTTIIDGFSRMKIQIGKLVAARDAMADCIYKMWDMCDQMMKAHKDASQSAGVHTVVGDYLDTAFNYGKEDRDANRADAEDIAENGLQRGLDAVFLDAEKLIYREQCFLLSYIQQISAWKKVNRDSAVPSTPAGAAPNASVATPGASPSPGPATSSTLNTVSARGYKRLPYQATSLNPDKTIANSSLLVDGDPYGFLNKLIQSPNQKALFNLENHQLSALQPMIRLFKIEYDAEGNERQHEIHFDSNANNIAAALKNKKQRGFGVGIKSFDFSYEGTNPFAVKKSIKAQLNIFANTFTELFEQRGAYRYIDLALKTGGASSEGEPCQTDNASQVSLNKIQNENLSKLNFRLKAVVGWAPQGQTVGSGGVLGSELRNAIYESYATLELTPTVHHFEFDEMGRVNFQINYLAYIEDYFDDTSFNIFTHPDLAESRLERELEIDYFSGRCDAAQISLLKKSFADDIRAERHRSLSHLINTIIRSRKIYYIKLPYDDIRQFLTKGPFAEYEHSQNFDELINDYSDTAALQTSIRASLSTFKGLIAPDDPEADAEDEGNLIAAALLSGLDSESESLPFIFVSELIDMIMENLETELHAQEHSLAQLTQGEGPVIRHRATRAPRVGHTLTEGAAADSGTEQVDFNQCRRLLELKRVKANIQQLKKMRVLLGPVEFVNPARGAESIFVNLGDIPLSMRYFMEWISEKMLNKEQSVYSLTKFLNDLFNSIIRNFLNNDTCFSYSIAQKTRVNQAVITSYPGSPNPQVDEITKYINSITQPGIREPKRAHISSLYTRSQPILRTSGIPGTPIAQRSVAEEMNYFVYFAGRTAPTEFMNGNKQQDESRGIFHYLLGRDRGMIKNISLSKTDSKGLAEVRFEQDGYDGLKQLRVVYDVLIDTYADVKTYPGTYLFVNPQGFDPNSSLIACHESNLTQYGIGGYFMIWKSEHSFGPGQASTKIHAKWVNQVEAEDCTIQSRGDDSAQPDGTNCGSARTERFRSAERERMAEEHDISMEEADEMLEQEYPT
jgi:hypothetical protein